MFVDDNIYICLLNKENIVFIKAIVNGTLVTQFIELGPAKGEACRHFILSIIPFGQSDVALAFDKALDETGGDALINVSTESSLYGFIPIYNVYTYTCTKVKGTAIKFEN